MLTIVDLDHTLVHSCREAVAGGHDAFPISVNGMTFVVHVRPYAVDFLRYLMATGECGVWTAGTREYMECVLDKLFARLDCDWRSRLTIAYSRDETTKKGSKLIKDLSALPKPCVLYDDDAVHARCRCNRGLVRLVPPFDAMTPSSEKDFFFLREMHALERTKCGTTSACA